MKLPKEGDFITIQSYKHDGSLHRTWRDTMVLKTTENAIIGVNDHTLVTESDGRRWVTREPAIVYFHKKYWFNIIAMNYSDDLDYILKEHVKILVDWINNGRGPFSEAYVNIWYKRYVELKNR